MLALKQQVSSTNNERNHPILLAQGYNYPPISSRMPLASFRQSTRQTNEKQTTREKLIDDDEKEEGKT